MARSAETAEVPSAKLLGFTDAHATTQIAFEKKFDAQIVATDQKAWLEQMAAAPNHVGSPHDKANADFMVAKFNEWGWDAHIETFQVLYPTPKKISVELVAPTHNVAKLQEPAVTGDRTSAQIADELPPYHVYGADGDVTAELVYVNQGMPDDYKELASHGIDVKGKIAIARYGGGWRGLKPKFAYEHGAIGCIVYSDPRDDGYGAGDAYPKGGFRPADGVQRGSVMDLLVYPGDPLTPGVGATAEADVLPLRAGDFSDTVAQYVDEMHKLADTMRESTELQHRMLDEKLYTLASDSTRAFQPPERDAAVPVLNLAPLDNALLRLKKSAKSCDDARADAMKAELKLTAA